MNDEKQNHVEYNFKNEAYDSKFESLCEDVRKETDDPIAKLKKIEESERKQSELAGNVT